MKLPVSLPLFPLLLLCTVLLIGCSSPAQVTEPTQTSTTAETASPTTLPPTEPCDPVEDLLARMTLQQKIGQLFVVRLDTLESSQTDGVIRMSDAMAAALSEYPVGGIAMFSHNIVGPAQITTLNRDLQACSEIPLFLAVDEEGGLVARLARNNAFALPKFDSAAAVGIQGTEAARNMGITIGSYLKEYGFNMDFAPVADVNTNPQNPVIGNRAFSSDPMEAAALSGFMAEGLRSCGIIPTFKHFPGHGDTAQDSHVGIALSEKSKDALAACEWIPFLEAGSQDCIMIGHIALPNVTGDLTPATLSPVIVTDILKNELGFQGLVITDSMEMGAITDSYSSGQAAVAALQSGCDLILMPLNLTDAFAAVEQALAEGTLTAQWLDDTVLRILNFKASHGILLLEDVP